MFGRTRIRRRLVVLRIYRVSISKRQNRSDYRRVHNTRERERERERVMVSTASLSVAVCQHQQQPLVAVSTDRSLIDIIRMMAVGYTRSSCLYKSSIRMGADLRSVLGVYE